MAKFCCVFKQPLKKSDSSRSTACLIRASLWLLIKLLFLHLNLVHWSSLVFYGPTVDEAVLLGFFLCYSWALGFDLFFDTFNGHTPVLVSFLEQHAKTPGLQTICYTVLLRSHNLSPFFTCCTSNDFVSYTHFLLI